MTLSSLDRRTTSQRVTDEMREMRDRIAALEKELAKLQEELRLSEERHDFVCGEWYKTTNSLAELQARYSQAVAENKDLVRLMVKSREAFVSQPEGE